MPHSSAAGCATVINVSGEESHSEKNAALIQVAHRVLLESTKIGYQETHITRRLACLAL
jgi:hypothetical protein